MAIELGVDTTLAFGIVASILILQSIYSAVFSKDVKAPQVGARWFWEPSFFTRHRFTRSAFQMVNDGYKKVGSVIFTAPVTPMVTSFLTFYSSKIPSGLSCGPIAMCSSSPTSISMSFETCPKIL